MNHKQAIDFIHSTYKFGSKLGLENITKLCELLGDPQNDFEIIHVAGTNGKGSICNMIHDVLVSSRYKVGLFISPYLEEFNERIQVNKCNIDNESLARITSLVKEKVDVMIEEGYNHPTEFEIVTAIGFQYFKEKKIDILVLEVGLGGRFDATNVVDNTIISVIASISYDHMQYLGNTLEEIAFEKAGIIKENSKVVVYPQGDKVLNVVKKQSKIKEAKIFEVNKMDALERPKI
jgi:dihydrofolate synthase/folylpolyglutamate synthase